MDCHFFCFWKPKEEMQIIIHTNLRKLHELINSILETLHI